MWSLPDIHRLNEEASRMAAKNANKTEKQLCRGETCEGYDCEKKAVHAIPWYDVFSDDPKGYIYQCEEHYNGGIQEGYFYCDRCGKYMIENYTWENYSVFDEETSEQLCLNCYFDQEIEKDENWIVSAAQITWERVRAAKHLIPVKGEHWKKRLLFIGNVELDSMTGGKITGFDSSSTIEDGLQELRKEVGKALAYNAVKVLLKSEQRKPRCILILDGAYQFAVSIGVYIDRWHDGKEEEDR